MVTFKTQLVVGLPVFFRHFETTLLVTIGNILWDYVAIAGYEKQFIFRRHFHKVVDMRLQEWKHVPFWMNKNITEFCLSYLFSCYNENTIHPSLKFFRILPSLAIKYLKITAKFWWNLNECGVSETPGQWDTRIGASRFYCSWIYL